jgi:LmbE family N-acetylglucosaminyl deacetylase
MKLRHPDASIFVPDGTAVEDAVARLTHLGIGAHQDDLEVMALHGILACRRNPDLSFGAVVGTDGAGSPRSGPYASYSDEEMAALRRKEQEKAAALGGYGILFQLNYRSAEVKNPADRRLRDDLAGILAAARPEVVYTHNPADSHDTHVAVAVAAVRAMRALPPDLRPRAVYGCEVWRDLDWLADAARVALDVGGNDGLADALVRVYDSQVAGGKRYDLAAAGRRRANATFFRSHGVDAAEELWFAMDLTPLLGDDSIGISEYVSGLVDGFRKDVEEKIRKFGG